MELNNMKRCPYCKSNRVIVSDSDNDLCPKCNKYFPSVKEEEDKCEAGFDILPQLKHVGFY